MSEVFAHLNKAKLSLIDEYSCTLLHDDYLSNPALAISNREHLYIRSNDLIARWQRLPADRESYFIIAETGFGCGLTFLLVLSLWARYAPACAHLYYIANEKNPLDKDELIRSLALWPTLSDVSLQLVDQYPVLVPGFHQLIFQPYRAKLLLMLGETLTNFRNLLVCGDYQLEAKIRSFHVDCFFVNGNNVIQDNNCHQLIKILAMLAHPGATLVAATNEMSMVNHIDAGGFVCVPQKQPWSGVFALFKQTRMVRGIRSTPWHVSKRQSYQSRKAIILGAGLAGCYSAYALAKKGWDITLIDQRNQPGMGASGNKHAILYPHFSAYASTYSEFMLVAYLYAISNYKKILPSNFRGELKGILQLPSDLKGRIWLDNLQIWLSHYPQLAEFVNQQHASQLAGIDLETGGLFVPSAGWLDAQSLCLFLSNFSGIRWVGNTSLTDIDYVDGLWRLGNHRAEVLILATNSQVTQFHQTSYIPLQPIRGQTTSIAATLKSRYLKIPLCAKGHILPAYDNLHAIGATYQPNTETVDTVYCDDYLNLEKLSQFAVSDIWSRQIKDHWVGVRAAVPDHLPVVGPVADANRFTRHFSRLAKDAKQWLDQPGDYINGLYVCTGFGSRGLTTIPFCAEWLASLIHGEPILMPNNLVQAISTARFLRRALVRPG
ncbi:MAG: FAD-dependent 5-carboxymethylaminomethyl-2-thiouridine(34) oxidoreductase MnmC [Legionella sp.]